MKSGIVSIEIRANVWDVIPRPGFAEQVGRALALSPVVAILGPRQCGKTTLARHVVVDIKHTWFDLEDPVNQRQLEAPELTLPQAEQLVVLDEIQLRPDLFPLLRVLVDQQPNRRFLILGSASPDLRRRSAESLAGRIDYVELAGFLASEVDDSARLWLRGGFPRSYLAATDEQSLRWRESFIRWKARSSSDSCLPGSPTWASVW
jgi:predicted AAA+ superfamily ATPase